MRRSIATRSKARRHASCCTGLFAWALTACVSAVGPDEAGRAGAVDAAASPAVEVEPATERDGAPPRPLDEALSRAPGRALDGAHAERAAWSGDGHSFVHCRRVPGLDCTECRIIGRDGTASSLESGPGCPEGAVPPATLDARLAALALAPSPARWRDGADVVLALETREHETTNAGDPRPMLKLGARRRTGSPPAWLLHVDPCEGCGTDQVCAAAAHLDVVALSPDAETLAVLVHQRSSQGDESLRVELLPTARVVEAARTPASRALP